jgi:streptogramin lyase
MAEFTEGHLGKIDAKTTKVTWYPIPTPNARARRMVIDDQDRIMVTEYRGNKVAVFDTAQTLRIGSASPAERLSTSRTDGCAPSQRRCLTRAITA